MSNYPSAPKKPFISLLVLAGTLVGAGTMFFGVVQPERTQARQDRACFMSILKNRNIQNISIKDFRCVRNSNGNLDVFLIE